MLATRNLRFSFVCDAGRRLARLVIVPVSGRLDRAGDEVVRNGGTQTARSVLDTANTLTVLGEPATPDVSASTTFEGIVQAAGAPAVRVSVGVRWSSPSCQLRLVATPIS